MKLLEVAREVRRHLEQNGRVSVRMLRRDYALDDEALGELTCELVDVQQIARREGNVLAWSGERKPAALPPGEPATPSRPSRDACKTISIVFVDLMGSTALQERLDPESVDRVMDVYYQAVRGPVEAAGGTVVQLLGDGVFCAFGIPTNAEDDALRAVRAAMGVPQAFREFLATQQWLEIAIGLRIAVNTGEVVVSDEHAAGIGDPLNVAARLQQAPTWTVRAPAGSPPSSAVSATWRSSPPCSSVRVTVAARSSAWWPRRAPASCACAPSSSTAAGRRTFRSSPAVASRTARRSRCCRCSSCGAFLRHHRRRHARSRTREDRRTAPAHGLRLPRCAASALRCVRRTRCGEPVAAARRRAAPEENQQRRQAHSARSDLQRWHPSDPARGPALVRRRQRRLPRDLRRERAGDARALAAQFSTGVPGALDAALVLPAPAAAAAGARSHPPASARRARRRCERRRAARDDPCAHEGESFLHRGGRRGGAGARGGGRQPRRARRRDRAALGRSGRRGTRGALAPARRRVGRALRPTRRPAALAPRARARAWGGWRGGAHVDGAGLDEVGSDVALGKEILGYSLRASMVFARARALVYLGRLAEAWKQVREAEHVVEESRELGVFTWVQVGRATAAYACGDPESTLEHGRRSLEIAEKLGNESSRMLAYVSLGYGYLLEAQPAAARDALRESVAIARDHRTQIALLPEVLAVLAEVHLALGERTEAVATAREGIELGRTGGCYYYEAEAQLALAAALLTTDGAVPQADIESALERAEQLVESIGGRSLSPRILEALGC